MACRTKTVAKEENVACRTRTVAKEENGYKPRALNSRSACLMVLLPKMVHPAEARLLLHSALQQAERVEFRKNIGQLADFVVENPTGHYLLHKSFWQTSPP